MAWFNPGCLDLFGAPGSDAGNLVQERLGSLDSSELKPGLAGLGAGRIR